MTDPRRLYQRDAMIHRIAEVQWPLIQELRELGIRPTRGTLVSKDRLDYEVSQGYQTPSNVEETVNTLVKNVWMGQKFHTEGSDTPKFTLFGSAFYQPGNTLNLSALGSSFLGKWKRHCTAGMPFNVRMKNEQEYDRFYSNRARLDVKRYAAHVSRHVFSKSVSPALRTALKPYVLAVLMLLKQALSTVTYTAITTSTWLSDIKKGTNSGWPYFRRKSVDWINYNAAYWSGLADTHIISGSGSVATRQIPNWTTPVYTAWSRSPGRVIQAADWMTQFVGAWFNYHIHQISPSNPQISFIAWQNISDISTALDTARSSADYFICSDITSYDSNISNELLTLFVECLIDMYNTGDYLKQAGMHAAVIWLVRRMCVYGTDNVPVLYLTPSHAVRSMTGVKSGHPFTSLIGSLLHKAMDDYVEAQISATIEDEHVLSDDGIVAWSTTLSGDALLTEITDQYKKFGLAIKEKPDSQIVATVSDDAPQFLKYLFPDGSYYGNAASRGVSLLQVERDTSIEVYRWFSDNLNIAVPLDAKYERAPFQMFRSLAVLGTIGANHPNKDDLLTDVADYYPHHEKVFTQVYNGMQSGAWDLEYPYAVGETPAWVKNWYKSYYGL